VQISNVPAPVPLSMSSRTAVMRVVLREVR
jgi:hypothetical protein